MHSYYINLLFEILSALGISKTQVIEHSGLNAVDFDHSIDLNSDQLNRLFASAIELSKDLQIGLKLGSKINMVPKGILGYALITSPSLSDALKLMVRYHNAVLPSMVIEFLEHDSDLKLYAKAPLLTQELENFYCDLFFSAIIATMQLLIDADPIKSHSKAALTLNLCRSQPKSKKTYHEIFGSLVNFGTEENVLSFNEFSLMAPIKATNHLAQDVFKRECEKLLPQNNHPNLVSEHVKRLLLEVRLSFPTCADVAKKLHMSESTLRRHLKKEGWRFQELLDQVRSNLANEYLTTTQLPVSEIASLLGFSDSTNFRRSFKRWSSKTPSQMRNENKAQI